MTDTVEARIAAVYQELADLEARDAAAAQLPPRRVRRQTGASVVYSVRLDPTEVRALEERAALADLKPTVLARNLIRSGLSARRGQEVTGAVDRVEAALQELRAVLR